LHGPSHSHGVSALWVLYSTVGTPRP
jgi:hypothetical protein